MTLAVTGHTFYGIALSFLLFAAVVVAILLTFLLFNVNSIENSVDGLLAVAGVVASQTSNIPKLNATAPVLELIVEEAVIQDGYMNALTDGFGGK